MKTKRLFVLTLLVSGLLSILVSDLAAQVRGNIVWAEYQMPKPARKTQYEAARKEMVKWHHEKKTPLPIYIWEVFEWEASNPTLKLTP